MNKPVTITPEIARLAQHKAKLLGTTLADEIAKVVVEEAILNLDPELGFLLDYDQSYSGKDVLAQILGVNDLVVNGSHMDVRAADSQGQVSINRALVDTSYLHSGTLVVKMEGPFVGQVVGHISAELWRLADQKSGQESSTSVALESGASLDLAGTLSLMKSAPVNPESMLGSALTAKECEEFVGQRQHLDIARQRQIVEMALHNEAVQLQIEACAATWSNVAISRIVDAAAVWNNRAEKLTDRLAAKFGRLQRAEIKDIVCRMGEAYGGQPEAPAFRKALLQSLVKAELVARLQGVDLAKVTQVVDKVLSGQPIIDAVNDFVKNKVAVEMAVAIKNQRRKVEGFMTATAEEIGMAFQQLALQPAYATHSQDPEAGVEAINDALGMLEAGELAEEIRQLEDELF